MAEIINVEEARAYARERWPSPVVRRPIEALLDECPRVGQQWISVEERLPEEKQWVIAYFGNLYGDIMEVLQINDGVWIDCMRTEEATEFITHWMPLPEPPKEV